MSLKDVIFTMSHDLVETCESSDELRLEKTAFTRKRKLGAKNFPDIWRAPLKLGPAPVPTFPRLQ